MGALGAAGLEAVGLAGVAGAARARTANTAATASAAPVPTPPPRPFLFTVIGDTPYSALEERSLREVLASQGPEIAFVIHLGDLKSGWERCSDELLAHRHAVLATSTRPLVFVPGDNEWVDCTRMPAGGFDPLDRLDRLRALFHQRDPSPAAGLEGFTRQPAAPGAPPFPEHMRWQHQSVGFLALNVPGSHDARSQETRLAQANRARIAAVRRWLDEAPAWAAAAGLRALVLASHANPGFERDRADQMPVRRDDPDDAYAWWRDAVRELASRVPLPILFLHGDTHTFRVDRPLRDRNGRTVEQFTRVECFGTPRATRWLTVTVPALAPAYFVVAPHELTSSQRP